jgi:hypothetical protein
MAVCVAVSAGKAVQIFWSAAKRLDRQMMLGLSLRVVNGQTYITTPWGNMIWLAGCSDKGDIEKFRGDRYCCAVVDEADSLRVYLRQLVEDAIGPALTDLGGWLGLSGTPGPIPSGYLYDATEGVLADWSVHRWTVADNPHMPDPQGILARAKRRLPEATFRREWMGEWCRDDDALVFPYDAAKNRLERSIPGASTVIGVDLGFNDACAWVVMQYLRGHPQRDFVHVEKRTQCIPSAAAAHTERLRREYPGAVVVADTGGIGKGYVSEWTARFGIPVIPAVKQQKAGAIAMMRGDLLLGNLKVDPQKCEQLLDDWQVLQWNEDHTDFDERSSRAGGGHADIAHAALYAWRFVSAPYRPEVEARATEDHREREYTEQRAIERAGKKGNNSWSQVVASRQKRGRSWVAR